MSCSSTPGSLTRFIIAHPIIYPCLSLYCGSTFQNAEDLDLHYKLVHCNPYHEFGFDGVPLANNIRSTAGEPSHPLSSFHSDANLIHNGSNSIGASLRGGPFVGHVDYSNDISLNQHHGGLPTPEAMVCDAFNMHQSSPSRSLVDDFSCINEPQTYASSGFGGDQLNTPALLSSVPIEAAYTMISPLISLPTAPFSTPAPNLQTPTTGAFPPPCHVCATCGKTFKWAQDVQRHAKIHDPAAQRYDCSFPGCSYTGAKGFLRRDKLKSHWQNRHQ